MTNEKPTNPSHGELLDEYDSYHDARVEAALGHERLPKDMHDKGRELRSLILGKMGEGWRCFHCNEVFTDEAEAREHFGDERSETPGCISPLRSDEKARLKEVADAWAHAKNNQADAEKKDDAEGLLESFHSELRRYFGDDCTSVWVAGDRYNNSRYALKLAEATASRLQSELEEAKRLVRVAENAFQLQDAFSVEGRAGELNGLQIAKAWLALEKRAEAAEARLAAQPDVREALKWAIEYIADGADFMSGFTPEHDCEFTSNPEKGSCDFHDKFFAAVSAAHLAPLAGVPQPCGEFAASFIPRLGQYFSCVLPKGHEGEHCPGGDCFTHGKYVGQPNQVPQCPQWPDCAKGARLMRTQTFAVVVNGVLPSDEKISEILADSVKLRYPETDISISIREVPPTPASHTPRCPKCGACEIGFWGAPHSKFARFINCHKCGEVFPIGDLTLQELAAQFFPVTSSQGGAE